MFEAHKIAEETAAKILGYWPPFNYSDAGRQIEEVALRAFNAGLEAAAVYAVAIMTNWTSDDDLECDEFRSGIEKACSDLAKKYRSMIKPEGSV